MREFFEEIKEEFLDFVEDFSDLLKRRPTTKNVKQKQSVIAGQLVQIRPAYLFAERIENMVKILFGGSVVLSAITSTFIGFASLSGLVESLIQSIPGRLALFVIGFSYMIVAIWKSLRLGQRAK